MMRSVLLDLDQMAHKMEAQRVSTNRVLTWNLAEIRTKESFRQRRGSLRDPTFFVVDRSVDPTFSVADRSAISRSTLTSDFFEIPRWIAERSTTMTLLPANHATGRNLAG